MKIVAMIMLVHGYVPSRINPIALRMAKTLYGVLAILSAIGINNPAVCTHCSELYHLDVAWFNIIILPCLIDYVV